MVRANSQWLFNFLTAIVAWYFAIKTPHASQADEPRANNAPMLAHSARESKEAEEHFEKKIRPILVEHCFECHTGEASKVKGGLRVDSRAALLRGGDSGPALISGKPEESTLLKALRHTDEDLQMPPDKPQLPKEILTDFAHWIKSGAVFPIGAHSGSSRSKASPNSHWAFQPVRAGEPPAVKHAAWSQLPIDRFIVARWEAEGITPGADAPPEVLRRRLHALLTGLPPAPEHQDAFAEEARRDPRAALERLTDRLLASPHFGERWARHWLDVVRYAESAGHEYDFEIEGAWRYRDYMTRSLNADVGWDQLFREHLMGDLLDEPRVLAGRDESHLGTAWWHFHEAATAPVDLANDEGDRIDNQIDTFGKAFQGLTLGCARCHHHKFEPITTSDYYALFGIVASSPASRGWANLPALEKVANKLRSARLAVDERHSRVSGATRKLAKKSTPSLELGGSRLFADFAAGVPPGWAVTGFAETVDTENSHQRGVPPGLWSGLHSKKLPAVARSPVFTIDGDCIDVLAAGKDATLQLVIANYQMIRDPIYGGLRQPVSHGVTSWKWYRFYCGRWRGMRAHLELVSGKIHRHERLLHTEPSAEQQWGLHAVVFGDGNGLPVPAFVVVQPYWNNDLIKPWNKLRQQLECELPLPENFIGAGEAEGHDIPIFFRGDARKPRGQPIPRRFLAIWRDTAPAGSVSARTGSGRRLLADAILAPSNPLTARVLVNRVWHHAFGVGLVATVDDFGTRGSLPTHPELLDWLTHRFTHVHGWRLKPLLRDIVRSRVWRLDSGPAPEKDVDNRWLSRFRLRRLDAEALRDFILATSGTLDRAIGGPSIPIPHDLADAGSGLAPPSGPADGARRRGIYLAVRRNYPSRFLETFDRPIPLSTQGRRVVTNSPTQALALLNDPFVQQCALAWANKITSHGDKINQATRAEISPQDNTTLNIVRHMYRAALARDPHHEEIADALELARDDLVLLALALFNLKEFCYIR